MADFSRGHTLGRQHGYGFCTYSVVDIVFDLLVDQNSTAIHEIANEWEHGEKSEVMMLPTHACLIIIFRLC